MRTAAGYGRAVSGPRDVRAVAAAFASDPDAAAVVTDFDGTLAPIVDDPETARPLEGAVAALHALADRYGRVAVVSGRPVEFLAANLRLDEAPSSRLVVSGLYGLERWDHGVVIAPAARQWLDVVRRIVDEARAADLDGAAVEDKGLSITLHFRTSPDAEPTVRAWVGAQAAATGLVVHAARRSYELRPPLAIDKGTVVADLIAKARAACFVGDDVGDLPAFDALDRLAVDVGAQTVRVAVRSTESPAELLERADLVVEGPGGALAFLRALLDAPAQPPDR